MNDNEFYLKNNKPFYELFVSDRSELYIGSPCIEHYCTPTDQCKTVRAGCRPTCYIA